jgi:hypothetical protein
MYEMFEKILKYNLAFEGSSKGREPKQRINCDSLRPTKPATVRYSSTARLYAVHDSSYHLNDVLELISFSFTVWMASEYHGATSRKAVQTTVSAKFKVMKAVR